MGTVLVVCASRAGQTKKIGELIAEGVRMEGHEAKVVKTSDIKSEADLQGYDGYIFGSATYHGDMLQGMKQLLFLAEKASLEGKAGGSFGAYGWSGEAPGRIFQTMLNIFRMDMVGSHLQLKSSALGGGKQLAQDYGRSIAEKI